MMALAFSIMPANGLQVPLPVVVLGLISGMTYGLLAVGLVLVFRANRFINFAHGEIGAFCAAVFGVMVVQQHVPYWLAFLPAVALGGIVAGTAEVAVVRRFRSTPRLMSVVATLGLAQLLFALEAVVNTQAHAGSSFPEPPGLPSLRVGALLVTSSYSAMLILTPVLVAALTFFLRYSRLGIAMRAAAANPDAARVSAIYASRMSTLAWAVAGGISAFTAIMIFPTRGFVTAASFGPVLLLRALVPAVLARMENLQVALAAGVAAGLLEQVLLWNFPSGGFVELVLFVVMLVALLTQRRRATRESEGSAWATLQGWSRRGATRLPKRLRVATAVGLVALIALVSTAPLVTSNATSLSLATVMAFSVVGLSVGVITGLAGELSLGQFALAGIGAAGSFLVARATGNYVLAFLAAGMAGAVASLVVGLPALRIRGLMLAATSLSFTLVVQGWLLQQPQLLGAGVTPGQPRFGPLVVDTGRKDYYLALLVLGLTILLVWNVRRTGLGRMFIALRDNEYAARAFTVRATARRLQAFAVAGFIAGVGGALFTHSLSVISSATFPPDLSISAVAMAAIGGLGTLFGPILGGLYIFGVPAFLPLDSAALAASALGWLILLLYFPSGLAGLIGRIRSSIVEAAPGSPIDAAKTDESRLTAVSNLAGRISPAEITATDPEAAGPPILEVAGLERRFGGVRAVDGVSLRVRRGELLGIIGSNGAGKTTLFELISGFAAPSAGTIQYLGKDIRGWGPERRGRAGLIRSFQDAALFPTMTVTEMLKLSLERFYPTPFLAACVGLADETDKNLAARELLSLMGLESYRDHHGAELSTGTRRIVELACLVALRPTLLLLDEPSAGIAQRETEALVQVIRNIRTQLSATIMLIEHDMPTIMALSDRVIVMESGRILAEDVPDRIVHNPAVLLSYLGTDTIAIQRSGATPSSPVVAPAIRA